MSKYGKPVWQIVQQAADQLEKSIFSPKDVIKQAHQKYPDVPNTTLRTYVIAMAPNHPSSYHYPSTKRNHPYFHYLGNGKFRLLNKINIKVEVVEKDVPNGPKTIFVDEHKLIIREWVESNFDNLIKSRKTYSWADKPTVECVQDRYYLQDLLVNSRIKNNGGVDLRTLDRLMDWGGMRRFAVDEDEAIEITRESFISLDNGDIQKATLKLLSIYGVGIASATKVIGLYDHNRFAIYDSRVGTALRSLVHNEKRIVKCPAGRSRPGDTCSPRKWAENYEKTLWILEIISNYLAEKGFPFNVSDVEMALFMMGK